MSFTVTVEVEDYDPVTDTASANIYMKSSDNYPKSEEEFEKLQGCEKVAASLTNELIGDYFDTMNSRGDSVAMTDDHLEVPKTTH